MPSPSLENIDPSIDNNADKVREMRDGDKTEKIVMLKIMKLSEKEKYKDG